MRVLKFACDGKYFACDKWFVVCDNTWGFKGKKIKWRVFSHAIFKSSHAMILLRMWFACQNIELMRTRLRMRITCDFISSHAIKHVFRIAKSLMRIFLHHMRIFYFFACEYSLTVACDEIIVACEKLFIACDLWKKKSACAIEISHAIFFSRMRRPGMRSACEKLAPTDA